MSNFHDASKLIDVPDVVVPVAPLCYKQAENMTRCDRKQGHGGMHTWEYMAMIHDLETLLKQKG